MPIEPLPCAGSGAGDGADVEQIVLCDLDAEGNLLGTALAVYEYDSDGNPTGPPTFVDPATGDPYIPQGTLQPCPDAACLPPMQFCQTSTTTGPVEHPGRQYDLTLPINPGFAVDSLTIDAVSHPAGITWSIFDVDGDDFAADLESFIQGRMPAGSTATVTNPNSGATEICGAAQPMTIHIECVRLDQNPPNLVELVYNGGEDLVQNPAYNTTPPTDLSQFQFYYLNRADGPAGEWGPVNCTSVANRGWETNDLGPNNRRDFEIWGTGPGGLAAIQNTTPTPRGTPVQEVTADINDTGPGPTIWQTFNVPAPGNFRVQLVHGARDPGETHTIRLSTGDTNDTGPGDIINDVTNPASVTNSGGPNPWTVLDQTVPLNSGEYTFSFTTTNPVGPNRGGLFTDMRVYVDRPGLRATAVNDDDTCVVLVDETTTNTICSYWQPQCAGGAVVGWQKVDTGESMTNAEFWAQVPTPGCCLSDSGGEGGSSSTLSNMLTSDVVCAVVGGIAQNVIRVVVTDPSGGTLQEQFLGANGAPVAPDSWTAGPCTASRFMGDQVLCDDNGPFLRKYVQSLDATNQAQVNSFRDFTLAGAGYTVVGEVRQCGGADTEIVQLCDTVSTGPDVGQTTSTPFLRHFSTGDGVTTFTDTTLDGTTPYLPAGFVFDCHFADVESHVVCDFGNLDGDGNPYQYIQEWIYNKASGQPFTLSSRNFDGTAYASIGPIGTCPEEVPDRDREVVCWTQTSTGDQLHTGTIRHDDSLPAPGWILFDQHLTPVSPAEPGLTFVPCTDCCPVVLATDLCATGDRTVTSLRMPDGTVLLVDQADGSTVLPADIVECPGCNDCETLVLCDFGADEPVLITGISTGGTLSNGVTWSGARGSAANFNPQHNNVDGSWWGMPSFPNATVAPDTWFFDRPVDVEFSVVIAHSPATGSGAINQVQVPIGSELISSAPDYSYDVATGIVTVDASNTGDCTKVTNPTVANSARFVLRNVTQFTLDFLGQRIAICGQFSNWRFGSIAVTPATSTFLRTICRDCDGNVVSVTDTEADGTTLYVPIGPVGECGTAADAEPQCFATQICVQPQGVEEFISNEANLTSTVALPNVDPVWQWSNDPVAGPWFNMYDVGVFPGWTTVDPGTTQGVANWVAPHPNSSPNTSGLPGEGPTIGPGNAEWYARAQFTLPPDANPASIRIAATVINADQLGVEFRLNDGAWQPVGASHIDPPFSFPAQVIPGAQAGLNEVFVHVRETVFGSGAAGVKMHLIASYDLGDQQSWTQIVCDDGRVSYFTNAGEQTDALPEDWVIVPCGGSGDGCPCVSAASIGEAVADALVVGLRSQHFDVLPGAPWTPALAAGAVITGITYIVLAGTATVVDALGATSIAALPTGLSVTWNNDQEGSLIPPASIAADTASRVYVTWTEQV